MELKEQVIAIYQYFACKLSKNSSFSFIPNKKQLTQIDTLLNMFHEKYGRYSFGFEVLYNYFLFQFSYWEDKDTRFGRNVMFDWVIGDKAFERYREAIANNSIYYSERINLKYFIVKEEIQSVVEFEERVGLFKIEEIERSRFLNKPNGLFHCLGLTSGFSEKSEFCPQCNFQKECRDANYD